MGIISVSNLGKAYKQYPTRWSRLCEWLLPSKREWHTSKWVLKNINFTISSGESVGIVGVNGAGKSTLLKMITGTTQPTTGTVHVQGRVSALLELGIGFHQDFTGRQNVYMAGQLLGHTIEEISTLMPEIEEFAGIEEYIDQAVRVYSSGMQVRLAFAVATAVRPDILIVDEALSVGDAAFQRKCFQRIEGFRKAGTTLLFVSHDTETVKKLCDKALFIRGGELEKWGDAKSVCDEYERHLFGGRKKDHLPKRQVCEGGVDLKTTYIDPSLNASSCELSYGNNKASINACRLTDDNGQEINVIKSGKPFQWQYQVQFREDVDGVIFAMMLKTKDGSAIYGVDSQHLQIESRKHKAGEVVSVGFNLKNPLAPGVYYFNCGVRVDTEKGVEFLSRRVDSAILRVTADEESTVVVGVVDLSAKLELQSKMVDA